HTVVHPCPGLSGSSLQYFLRTIRFSAYYYIDVHINYPFSVPTACFQSGELNRCEPLTSSPAPASMHIPAVSSLMPPSTSISKSFPLFFFIHSYTFLLSSPTTMYFLHQIRL